MIPSEVRVLEYLDATGASPFGDWFDGLDGLAAAKVTVAVEQQLAWPVILPHSRMLPSRVIVASFKCSPTLPSAEPGLQGSDGLDPAVRPACEDGGGWLP